MNIRVYCTLPLILLAGFVFADDSPVVRSIDDYEGLPSRIAFGSCAKEFKPQPILKQVVAQAPDLFVYLGDNIYADTKDVQVLRDKYQQLDSKPEFQALRKNITVLSIWDDHDYGWNDAGKEYPKKNESREIFFDFWKVPEESPRRQHPGIYGSHLFEQDGKRLQIILLDTRFFRDPLKRLTKEDKNSPWKNDYEPDPNPAKTMLGEAQWKWLEKQFQTPADVRIVCSSIQFGHEYNGWESWTNLPAQQQKMFDLIKSTKANGVVFISGDVHWAEISKRQPEGFYPIYDITASGLTEDWHNVEPNKYRIGEAYRDNHFGTIDIDWKSSPVELKFQIIGLDGKTQRSHTVSLDDLHFSK
ncbi:MAG: alkaline phosphatase family protein [Planctomycetaceae bacterium]|nr:alkaline phosphatase family protein [Planctomycetaceae bacterium]